LALNRYQTYKLLGQLFTNGLTEEVVGSVREVDKLAQHLPTSIDLEEAAADHQHIFGFNVFPYESVFLDPSGQLGGDIVTSTIRDYRQAGYDADSTSASPDHIGDELAFLAFLNKAGAQAREQNNPAKAKLMGEYQRSFLDEHTLRWMPPLVLAIQGQRHPFYRAVATLMQETIMTHRKALGDLPSVIFKLPEPPILLEDEKTGLREIADYFLTTSFSGIFLSRDDIGRLARDNSVPRGFGDRQQMLVNLLKAAATYGDVGLVLSSLQETTNSWAASYEAMANSSEPIQSATTWAKRVVATYGIIAQMSSRIVDAG
jgi:TorA maturation chaperone TorD